MRNGDSDSGVRCSLGQASLRLMRSMPLREGGVQLKMTAGGSIMVSGSVTKCNTLFVPYNSILGGQFITAEVEPQRTVKLPLKIQDQE